MRPQNEIEIEIPSKFQTKQPDKSLGDPGAYREAAQSLSVASTALGLDKVPANSFEEFVIFLLRDIVESI